MANSLFKKFLKADYSIEYPEDFIESFEEAIHESLAPGASMFNAHNAKDLEKLIMPLLEHQSKPQIEIIIEAIQHKYILGRNMECQSD